MSLRLCHWPDLVEAQLFPVFYLSKLSFSFQYGNFVKFYVKPEDGLASLCHIRSESPRKPILSFNEEPVWEMKEIQGWRSKAWPWYPSVIYKRRIGRRDNRTERTWGGAVAMGTQRHGFPHMGQKQALTSYVSLWFEYYSQMFGRSCSPLRIPLEAYLSYTPAKLPFVFPKMQPKWPNRILLVPIWLLLRDNQKGCSQCDKLCSQSLQQAWGLQLTCSQSLVHSR